MFLSASSDRFRIYTKLIMFLARSATSLGGAGTATAVRCSRICSRGTNMKLSSLFGELRQNKEILCIHGYRQNGDVFKQKTGALRKMLKKHAEFVFVTAPMRVPPLEPSEPQTTDASSNLEQYGWWFSDENNGFNSKKPSEVCIGFTKSLEVITNTFKESGPFDGLLGFSQGASFVSVLCGMHERGCLPFSFKFAILVAGFRSLCSPHYKNYLKTIRIPTLHVYGETDQIIPKEMSEELTSYFLNPVKMVHPGGHYVPASGKDVYIKFLEEGIWEVMEEEECEEHDSASECNDESDDSET